MGNTIDAKTLQEAAGLHTKDDESFEIQQLKDSLTEDMQSLFELLEKLCLNTNPGKGEEKSKDKTVDDVNSVADLRKFQYSPIAGSILLHHDFEKLFDILKGMSISTSLGTKEDAPKEKKSEKSGKKVSFIKNLGEVGESILGFFKAVVSIGIESLKIMMLAPAILLSIPVIGILVSGLSKIFSKKSLNKDEINEFGEAAKSIGDGIKSIAVGILILPLLAIPLLLSIPLLPILKFFVKSLSGISATASKEAPTFKKSLLSFALLAGALVILGISIFLAKKMGKDMMPAIKSIGLLAVVLVGVIAAGVLAGFAKWGLIALGLASILMSVAFLTLSFAIKILSKIDKDFGFKEIIKMVSSLLIIVVAMALIGVICLFGLLPIAVFAVFSLLLLIGFAAFTGAMWMLSKAQEIMNKSDAVATLKEISEFIIEFAKMAPWFLLGALASIYFAVFSILLAVGSLLFLISVLVLKGIAALYNEGAVTSGLAAITDTAKTLSKSLKELVLGTVAALAFALFAIFLSVGSLLFLVSQVALIGITKLKDDSLKGVSAISEVAKEFGTKDMMKKLGLSIVAAAELLVFSAVFLVANVALLGAMVALLGIVEITKKIKSELGGNGDDLLSIYNYSIGALWTFTTGKKALGENGVEEGGILAATKNCAKLTLLAGELIAFTAPLAAAFLALVSVFHSLEKLKASVDTIGGKEEVDKILSSVGIIFSSLANTAESFKGMSAKAIAAIGSLVKDTAEAISLLADTIIKIKDGIKIEEVSEATAKIKVMCEKLFGTGAKDEGYTLTKLFKTLSDSSLKKLRKDAVECLVPIIEAIDRLGDTVIKMGDSELFSDAKIDAGINNFTKISKLLGEFGKTCSELVKRESGDTVMSKIFGNKSPLEAVKNLIKENFFDNMSEAIDKFDMVAQKMQDLKVGSIETTLNYFSNNTTLFSNWINNTQSFGVGLKNLSDGMNKMNQKNVDAFNSFVDGLSKGKDIGQAVDALIKFAEKANAFSSIAQSFKSMSDSLSNISKHKGGFLDIMKSANEKSSKKINEVANVGKSDNEKLLDKLNELSDILRSFVPSSNVGLVPGVGIQVNNMPGVSYPELLPTQRTVLVKE